MLAAMRVALQGGLGAMTVRQIAAEAGVSTATCITISPPSANLRPRPSFG